LAEAIAMVAELLDTVNLTSAKVRVSHRQLLAGLARAAGVPEEAAASVYRSIDKLDKIGREGVQREIIGMSVEPIAADRLLSSVTISGESHAVLAELGRLLPVDPPQEVRAALVELAELFDLLSKLSSRPEMFVLDPSLARGLDYYTGIVYEAVVEEPKVGSVSGGGRYDGLVGMFSGRPLAANGISMGLERIVEVVNEFGLLEAPVTVCDAIVTYEAETLPHAAQVARIAREAGWNVDLSVATRKGLGEQLKYASRRGIPRALIVGRTEADAGTVSLRDLQTGEQETLPVEALADRVRAMTRDRR
jgi:histidyl-tRNA synthetase